MVAEGNCEAICTILPVLGKSPLGALPSSRSSGALNLIAYILRGVRSHVHSSIVLSESRNEILTTETVMKRQTVCED